MQAQTVAGTVFTTLESAVDTLHDALRASESFNQKVRGPIPCESETSSLREEPSLSRLAHEVLKLSQQIKQEIETHHNVVGESREKDIPKPAIGRAASGY